MQILEDVTPSNGPTWTNGVLCGVLIGIVVGICVSIIAVSSYGWLR